MTPPKPAARPRSEPRVGRPPLVDREAIVRAAVEVGFDRVAMTTVGERLGVKHSALYRYFATRDALVAAAVDSVVDAATWPDPGPGLDWRGYLSEFAWCNFRLMERHPGLAEQIVSLRVASQAYSREAHRAAAALGDRGFRPADAILAQDLVGEQVLFFFLVGRRAGDAHATTDEVARLRRDLMAEPPPGTSDEVRDAMAEAVAARPDTWFARKLDVVLDGLERLAPRQ
ncbi:MAG: TetR/AcrR family transcriptional regulator [Streptomycetaceae bacterium]|nr:TetR/AcrR family transcriptional regulator [Streptomycetaceae bacterium]